MNIQKVIEERIKENEKQFTSEELDQINKNKELIKKIYLLGSMDSINAFLGNVD